MQILIALLSPHKYEDSRFSAKICARCERGIRHLLSYDKLDALNIRFYCCVRVKHFQHDQMLSIAAGNQAVAGGGGGGEERVTEEALFPEQRFEWSRPNGSCTRFLHAPGLAHSTNTHPLRTVQRHHLSF